MRHFLVVSLFLFAAVSAFADHKGKAVDGADNHSILTNTYSNGYRLGIVSRPTSWIGSHDAVMQVGLATGFVAVKREYDFSDPASNIVSNPAELDQEKHELISPWSFSAWGKDLDFINKKLMGRRFAVIHYVKRQCRRCGSGILQSSDYLFKDGFLTTGKPFLPLSYEVSAGSNNWAKWGDFGGLIVKVSHRGLLFKKWEIQLEDGSGVTSSNNFITMTIQDDRLARYAILAMMTGLPVKVAWSQAYLGVLRPLSGTYIDAYKIEFASEYLDPAYTHMKALQTVPAELIETGSLKDIDNYVIKHMRAKPQLEGPAMVESRSRQGGEF